MTGQPHARVAGVAAYLPPQRVSSSEVEDRLAETNPGLDVPRGLIEKFTGIRYRHVAPGETSAELAAAAVRKLLADTGKEPAEIDLVIFASVSTNLLEPATGHVLADLIGATCPVFDVKNACNAVVNAIEIGDCMIKAGRYERILIACGESVSGGLCWSVGDLDEYIQAVSSFTLSDVGAAVLLEASDEPGLLGQRFAANSSAWRTSTLPLVPAADGGWRVGRFTVQPMRLTEAYLNTDLSPLTGLVGDLGHTFDDMASVGVTQASLPMMREFCRTAAIAEDKVTVVATEHGYASAACLPLQLSRAVEEGRVRHGDLVAWFGLGSGLTFCSLVLRW